MERVKNREAEFLFDLSKTLRLWAWTRALFESLFWSLALAGGSSLFAFLWFQFPRSSERFWYAYLPWLALTALSLYSWKRCYAAARERWEKRHLPPIERTFGYHLKLYFRLLKGEDLQLKLNSALAAFFALTSAVWLYPPPAEGNSSVLFTGLTLAGILFAGSLIFHTEKILSQKFFGEIEKKVPRAEGFLSALQFGRELDEKTDAPYSHKLAEARIQQVKQQLHTIPSGELLPEDNLSQAGKYFSLAALAILSVYLSFPTQFKEFFYSAFTPPKGASSVLRDEIEDIVVGDITLTYRYPDYTKKPARTIRNSDGEIIALKGTEVLIQAKALEPVKKAELKFADQSGVNLKIGRDRRTLWGTFQVLKPGAYRFVLTNLKGQKLLGINRTVQVLPDAYPKVKLLWPDKKLKLQQNQPLTVAYRFSDDFGITEVYFVYQILGSKHRNKKQKIKIQSFKEHPKKGTFRKNIAALPLNPGDKVAYYIEVVDNDVISGPKRAQSKIQYLEMFSPLKRHEKLLKKQEELLDKMVIYLGDLLELPESSTALPSYLQHLHRKSKSIIKEFEILLEELQKDVMAKTYTIVGIENLLLRFKNRHRERKNSLEELSRLDDSSSRKFALAFQQIRGEVSPQEDDVYAFSLLINKQRLDVLTILAKKLSQSQSRLTELLDKYRITKDPKIKAELLREMDKLEKLIREINRRMHKLNREIPDDYLNMRAFKNRHSLQHLKKMRSLVKRDKLEEAAMRLSQLAQNIEEMISQMERYSKQAGNNYISQLSSAIKMLQQKLQQLEVKQQRLAQKTHQLHRDILQKMQRQLQQKLKKNLKKYLKQAREMEKNIQKIKQELGPFLRRYRAETAYDKSLQRTKELKQMLENGDVFESLKALQLFQNHTFFLESSLRYMKELFESYRSRRFLLKPTARSLRKLKKARQIAEKLQADLKKLMPKSYKNLSPQQRQKLSNYTQSQRQLRRELQKIQRQLSKLSKQVPIFPPKLRKQLQQASEEMRRAHSQLKNSAPNRAFEHQEKAIQKLKKARQQLKKAVQRRKRKGDQRQGERESLSQREKVDIPKESAKPPKELRQDILEAMREKFPEKYKEIIQKYYEKLVK